MCHIPRRPLNITVSRMTMQHCSVLKDHTTLLEIYDRNFFIDDASTFTNKAQRTQRQVVHQQAPRNIYLKYVATGCSKLKIWGDHIFNMK